MDSSRDRSIFSFRKQSELMTVTHLIVDWVYTKPAIVFIITLALVKILKIIIVYSHARTGRVALTDMSKRNRVKLKV